MKDLRRIILHRKDGVAEITWATDEAAEAPGVHRPSKEGGDEVFIAIAGSGKRFRHFYYHEEEANAS